MQVRAPFPLSPDSESAHKLKEFMFYFCFMHRRNHVLLFLFLEHPSMADTVQYREKPTYLVDGAAYMFLFISPHDLQVSPILNLPDP
jgi:hypothetical protein